MFIALFKMAIVTTMRVIVLRTDTIVLGTRVIVQKCREEILNRSWALTLPLRIAPEP